MQQQSVSPFAATSPEGGARSAGQAGSSGQVEGWTDSGKHKDSQFPSLPSYLMPSSLTGQKSIATTARQDLEKMAALATLAQQGAAAGQQGVPPSPWSTAHAALPVIQGQGLGTVPNYPGTPVSQAPPESPMINQPSRFAQSRPSASVGHRAMEDLSGLEQMLGKS